MNHSGVSIIIPVCNLIGFTRLCVDYIIKNTDIPYELVIIDNGSTDQTQDYFKKISNESKPM